MDNSSFDKLAAALAGGAPRRRVLGGLAALLAGAAVAAPAAAKKGGNGRGKGGNGKGKGGGGGNAHGKNKVAICHVTERGENRAPTVYAYKEVPPTALKGHLKHGDVEADCSAVVVGECQVLGCDAAGACVAVADPDCAGDPGEG